MNQSDKMIQVTVKYMSRVKKAAGTSGENLSLPSPCTVQALITERLCKENRPLSESLLSANGDIQEFLMIFVGDTKVDSKIPMMLKDGDEVLIMSPISGG